MKQRIENFFYFLTLWFSASIIVLAAIGIFFTILKRVS